MSGRLKVNNPQVLHTAALNGDGVELDPTFIVGADIAAGRLVELMPNYRPIETDLSVVCPPGRQLSAKLRSFVDFLASRPPLARYTPVEIRTMPTQPDAVRPLAQERYRKHRR